MILPKSKISRDVLAFFFLHGQSALYVNELGRRLKLDSGNLARKLIQLEKDGLLRSELKGKQKYYSLNHAFPLINEYRKIAMKTWGFEYLLQRALQGVQGIEKAYIYGSYAKDKMDASSDIDLLMIGRHQPLELQKKIAELQKKTNREINVVSLTPAEYEKKRKTDPLVKSILDHPSIPIL